MRCATHGLQNDGACPRCGILVAERLARAEEALREITITRSGRSGMRRIAQRGLGEDPDAPS
jgi:hypothetical protein